MERLIVVDALQSFYWPLETGISQVFQGESIEALHVQAP